MGAAASVGDDEQINKEKAKELAGDKWNEEEWELKVGDAGTVSGKDFKEYKLPRLMTKDEEESQATATAARQIARRTSVTDLEGGANPEAEEKMTKYMATRGRGGARRSSAIGTEAEAAAAMAALGMAPSEEETKEEEAKEEEIAAPAEEAKEDTPAA